MHSLQCATAQQQQQQQLVCHLGHLPVLQPLPLPVNLDPPPPPPPFSDATSASPCPAPPPPPHHHKPDLLTRLLHRRPLLHRLELIAPSLSSTSSSASLPSSLFPSSLFPSSPPPPAYHLLASLPPLLTAAFLQPLLPSLSLVSLSPSPVASSVQLHSSHLHLHLNAEAAQTLGLPSVPSSSFSSSSSSSSSPASTSYRRLSVALSPPAWQSGRPLYERVHSRLSLVPPLQLLLAHCQQQQGEQEAVTTVWPEGVRCVRRVECEEDTWRAEGVAAVDVSLVLDRAFREAADRRGGSSGGVRGKRRKEGTGDEGSEVEAELFDWLGLVAYRLTDLLPSAQSSAEPWSLVDSALCAHLPLLSDEAMAVESVRATGLLAAAQAVEALQGARRLLTAEGGRRPWAALMGWAWDVGMDGGDGESGGQADWAVVVCDDGRYVAYEALHSTHPVH